MTGTKTQSLWKRILAAAGILSAAVFCAFSIVCAEPVYPDLHDRSGNAIRPAEHPESALLLRRTGARELVRTLAQRQSNSLVRFLRTSADLPQTEFFKVPVREYEERFTGTKKTLFCFFVTTCIPARAGPQYA